MKKAFIAMTIGAIMAMPVAQASTPAEDLKLYQNYFFKKFPKVKHDDFGNGVYAIDKVSRDSWEAIEEFPPYEPNVDKGEAMWNKAFANGKGYKDCFKDGPAQRKNFPYFDTKKKKVMTLPQAVNDCRKANGEKPLKYKKGKIADLLAYMGYESRGQKVDVKIPNKDAEAAYNKGKQIYFARRGQLNFSCASCHMESSGQYVRSDILSPALGHTTGWPVYRSKWGGLGTLQRRFTGCMKQMRAKPYKAQRERFNNLEYFLSHMSNGMTYNGPSARK